MEEEVEVKPMPTIRRLETGEEVTIHIPICCREGWDSCPHVAKPTKKKKTNIGL